jgi:hypothetical protein
MADIKVSELTEATDTTATDKFMIVQGGASKSIKLSTLLAKLRSDAAIAFNLVSTDWFVQNSINKVLYVASAGTGFVGVRTDTPTEALHVLGNTKVGKTGASGADGVFIGSSEVLDFIISPAVGASISASRETAEIMASGASTFTLGAGLPGQTKILLVKQLSGSGAKATVTVADGISFNTITLGSVGAACTMKFIDGKWYIIGLSPSGVVASTV